ncbi:MAG: outer membrane lipoprotein chaperone LolA [Thermodesulfobacteriota bacterium]
MKRRVTTALTTSAPLAALLLLTILAAPGLGGGGGAPGADEVVARVQQRYESITTVTASFTQEVFSRGLGSTEVSSGEVTLKKPGKMRWVYREPAGDEITSDGRTFWLYQADLGQVVRRPAEEVTSSVATDFLSGVGRLAEEFDVTLDGESPETYILGLVPTEGLSNIKRLSMEVDKKTFLVVSTTTEDLFGNTTKVTFRDIATNVPVEDGLFSFVPPAGAVVID